MTQFLINYLTVDAVSSLVVGLIIYKRRHVIRAALRAYLSVPAPCTCEHNEEDFNDGEEI
jgi:hypothetical protein